MPTEDRPIWRALGTVDLFGAERRYCIELASGRLLVWRASQLVRLPALMEIYPDAAHWRRCFPAGAKGIDVRAAAAEIMRQCEAAGPVDTESLPEDVRPRPAGRPGKAGVE